MALQDGSWRTPILFGAFIAAWACVGPARADVISSTATLPLLDAPYVASTGAGCFTTAGVCVAGGSLTLTSLVSTSFNSFGQDILTDAVYTATLTNLGNTPIGSLTLTGTVEQEVIGRFTSTQTGSWTDDLVAVALSGPALGNTLTLGLDPSDTSSGTTSIVPVGDGTFLINSFFDVFVDLSLDSPTPLQTSVGPIELTATAAPEPAGLVLLGLPLLTLCAVRLTASRAAQPDGVRPTV